MAQSLSALPGALSASLTTPRGVLLPFRIPTSDQVDRLHLPENKRRGLDADDARSGDRQGSVFWFNLTQRGNSMFPD